MQMSKLASPSLIPQEGTYFKAGPNGISLTAYIHNPTPREERTFKSGGITAGLLEYKGVIFFLSKIKGFDKDWSDAPFCAAIESSMDQGLPVRKPHEGRALKLTLKDPVWGRIYAERTEVLPASFCDVFDELYARQFDGSCKHNQITYNSVVDEAYNQWPTGQSMMRDALLRNIVI